MRLGAVVFHTGTAFFTHLVSNLKGLNEKINFIIRIWKDTFLPALIVAA